ncbi:uncharacterized protein SOCE836_028470 [Sorangium cellulosum]|uniref:Uncharacterized protein n=1 Tax=Sorangium cellulosum TaxID=56 RepID=A0A4P2QLN9_SORCE|nr:uncharacterized protein SOCE836_028470 [Sorangium cellulosum]
MRLDGGALRGHAAPERERRLHRNHPTIAMGTAPCGSRRGPRCWARGGVGPRLGAGTGGPERGPGEVASTCVADQSARGSGRVGVAGARSREQRVRPGVGQQFV